MKIIDGHKGEYHISSQQIADANAALWGAGDYVLDVGSKFEPTIISANTVTFGDGVLMTQGRRAGIDYGLIDTLTFANGSQGATRHDLVVARYARDIASSNTESIILAVIQGANDGTDPTPVSGNVRHGAVINEIPLYRVVFEGISLVRIDTLYKDYASHAAKKAFREAHPVNSLYETVASDESTAEQMAGKWGGTWQAFGSGRVTVGVDTTDTLFNTHNKVGGNKNATLVLHSHTGPSHVHTGPSHSHTCGTDSPDHGHTFTAPWCNGKGQIAKYTDPVLGSGAPATPDAFSPPQVGGATARHAHAIGAAGTGATGAAGTGATSQVGASGTNANLPPYITVYRWLRTD